MKKKLLFLCTGNSCRSQMAEGFARFYHSDKMEVYSAGIETHGLNPNAVKVMAESGVDISTHQSQTIEMLDESQFDLVITVCGHADENCPYFPGVVKIVHHGFDDPPKLAEGIDDDNEKLNKYREVRDAISRYIQSPEFLAQFEN